MEMLEREQIISLIKREVVPAIGCTEPIAVALCAAKAKEILGEIPTKIDVYLSANVLKNAMGVGIPGTGGMIGLPIAIAVGTLIGKSEYMLEVLKDCNEDVVALGKKMIDDKVINISLKQGIKEKLYIEVNCSCGNNTSTAVIAGMHTNFIFLKKNIEVLLDEQNTPQTEKQSEGIKLNLKKVYEFSMSTPFNDIRFILEAGRINKNAAEVSIKGNYGHSLGRILCESLDCCIVGKNYLTSILSYTSAACDARMAGAMIPVMSNSGSGNQGITATLPVVIFAEKNGNTEEDLARALILSHLTAIYIKQNLGRLSALCGCVVAGTGSSCGIVHLMGGGYNEVSYAVKNMIANLTGMICDGAKPSCSMKLTSGVSTAVFSAMLAMKHKYVTSVEGIIDDDVDKCIINLTKIGSEGMAETDRYVLDIMTSKS